MTEFLPNQYNHGDGYSIVASPLFRNRVCVGVRPPHSQT